MNTCRVLHTHTRFHYLHLKFEFILSNLGKYIRVVRRDAAHSPVERGRGVGKPAGAPGLRSWAGGLRTVCATRALMAQATGTFAPSQRHTLGLALLAAKLDCECLDLIHASNTFYYKYFNLPW